MKGSERGWEIGEGLNEMYVTELFEADHFIIVERSALQDIVKEHELGVSGLVRQEGAAQIGQLLGAQFLVKGVASEFQYKAEHSGLGIGF